MLNCDIIQPLAEHGGDNIGVEVDQHIQDGATTQVRMVLHLHLKF